MVYAAKIHFLPSKSNETDVQNCASVFNIPGLDWCPETLLDISQLDNFYKQISLEDAINNPSAGFPNAIYLNGLDWEGTIRTGTNIPWGATRSGSDAEHANANYAYADTLILYNVRMVCSLDGVHYNPLISSSVCENMSSLLESRRLKHPMTRWDDPKYGRSSTWPK
jgi:hypothetical protein